MLSEKITRAEQQEPDLVPHPGKSYMQIRSNNRKLLGSQSKNKGGETTH